MKFIELLREAAAIPHELNAKEIGHLLRGAADLIEHQQIYKLRWAEAADKCARLERENESLLAKTKTTKDT